MPLARLTTKPDTLHGDGDTEKVNSPSGEERFLFHSESTAFPTNDSSKRGNNADGRAVDFVLRPVDRVGSDALQRQSQDSGGPHSEARSGGVRRGVLGE